jgi:hypothetical protein
VTNRNYLTFSSYITTQADYPRYASALEASDNADFVARVWDIQQPMESGTWINHPEYRRTKYHFCSAMSRSNMLQLGGFNPEFADGYAFDDDEFLYRVEQSGLDVEIVNPAYGFVSHQWHVKDGKYSGGCPEWHKNKNRMAAILGPEEVKKRWG